MHSDERRKAIADVLRAADAPVSASALAEKFSVSRQIIVGDIALLRSSGEEILATPRGYVTPKEARGILRRVAVKHTPEYGRAPPPSSTTAVRSSTSSSTTPSTASFTRLAKIPEPPRGRQFIERRKRRSYGFSLTDGIHSKVRPVLTRRVRAHVARPHCASCRRKTGN